MCLKVFISHHPYQARNGKITGGTGSQKLSDQCVKESFLDPIMLEERVPGAVVPAATAKDSSSTDEASIDGKFPGPNNA